MEAVTNTPFTRTPTSTLLFRMGVRLLLVSTVFYGLYLNLYAAFGTFQPWLLLFYTTQSNALVMLLFVVLCVHDLRNLLHFKHTSKTSPYLLQHIKVALTWAIAITGIVWHLLLASQIQNLKDFPLLTPELLFSFSLLHTWSPVLAFADWLLFDRKGFIRPYMPWLWLIIPTSYLIFICTWVHYVGPVNINFGLIYPYPFIDFTTYGMQTIWCNIGMMASGMIALGYIFYGIDCGFSIIKYKK